MSNSTDSNLTVAPSSAEVRAAEGKKQLDDKYESEIGSLKKFIEEFDDTPHALTKVIASYRDNLQLLSKQLNDLVQIFNRTMGVPTNRVWRTHVEKSWLFGALATALNHFASIIYVLQLKNPLPVAPEHFRTSASNLRRIAEIHCPDPEDEGYEKRTLEDYFLETGGFPFVIDAAQLHAHVFAFDMGASGANGIDSGDPKVELVSFNDVVTRLKQGGRHLSLKSVKNMAKKSDFHWGEPEKKGPGGRFLFRWTTIAPILEQKYGIKFSDKDGN